MREEPKIETAGPTRDITSIPSTNSAMMRKIRQVSSAAVRYVNSPSDMKLLLLVRFT